MKVISVQVPSALCKCRKCWKNSFETDVPSFHYYASMGELETQNINTFIIVKS